MSIFLNSLTILFVFILLQNTRNYPFEYSVNDDNEYLLNEINQKRFPSPRFGHAATKYN